MGGKNQLGHSTMKITYDIYVHLMDEDLGNVTSILDTQRFKKGRLKRRPFHLSVTYAAKCCVGYYAFALAKHSSV